ncbi:hypothetical protein [Microbacterium sp. Leaf159]|uniref:hypothetical protein n=1 Tax=unclassified Microbacterium TaxID=2609290 RepID=UPI0006FAA155|nr:hypothetical protein [Microbacterium sp. Leaf159]
MNYTYTDRMRLSATILVGALALAALAGCTAPEAATNPYGDRIEEAQSQATTDFEKQVFDDGELTRVEYEEAVNRYVECMEAQSVQITPLEQTGYFVFSTSSDSAAYDASDEQCRPGTLELVEPLYVDMTMNPENRPFTEVVRECLVARDAIDDGFTTDDLNKEMSRGGPLTETEDYTTCIANPSYSSDEG